MNELKIAQSLEKISETLHFIVGYVDGLRTRLQMNSGNQHFDFDVDCNVQNDYPTTQQTLTGGQQQ